MSIDEELKIPYDVLLTKIDVKKPQWGLYNFYKMQVCNAQKWLIFNDLNIQSDELCFFGKSDYIGTIGATNFMYLCWY